MKRTHQYYQESLSAFIDHELDPATCAELREHLSGCAECRALLADLEGVRQFVHTAGTAEVSPFFMTRLHQRLEEPETFLDPITWFATKWITALSFLTIGLLVVSLVGRTEKIQSPDDYYLNRQTPAEQRVLTQKKAFTQDEVLMIAMTAERNERR